MFEVVLFDVYVVDFVDIGLLVVVVFVVEDRGGWYVVVELLELLSVGVCLVIYLLFEDLY